MHDKKTSRFEAILRIDRELYEIASELKSLKLPQQEKLANKLRAQLAGDLEQLQDSAYASILLKLKQTKKRKP